ncbi:substrate-binding domain-containing protein [Caproicibacter fermentans]|nr:substrate-binding domain-containing protein [Caproicibacter fermentans]
MKKIIVALTALSMLLSMAACSSGSSNAASSAAASESASSAAAVSSAVAASGAQASNSGKTVDVSKLTIAYVPTTMNNPFWSAMMSGIKKEMTAKGMDPSKQLVTVDAESDQTKMNNDIYDLINQKVSAIIMAPMDCTACTEALQACADAKIPVINVDTPVDRTDLVVSVIASDNYNAGVQCAKDMMGKLSKGSKIYIMDQPSGTACKQREKGFKDTIGSYFKIDGTSDTEGDTAKSLSAAEDAITADKDLSAFFCINDMGALGCVQACAAAKKSNVLIYGVDGNPGFMSYISKGAATATAAQQPSVVGADAIDTVISHLSGANVNKNIVVPVELISKSNLAKFDITKWQ